VLNPARPGAAPRPFQRMQVYFDGRFVDTSLYRHADLPAGAVVEGAAIIEESGTTTVLFEGWSAAMDDAGNLRLYTSKEEKPQ
jgi:N-methylhydantoinase A/oxoprolinase/acetone carboxylase beta subunit